jgi:hypothetical protein
VKIVKLPRKLLNPLALPGMGRSMELHGLEEKTRKEIHQAFTRKELHIQFEDGKNVYPVINLWADPHDSSRITLFIE